MTQNMRFVLAVALAMGLAGCSSIKNPFSGNDDTVLPGDREDILPSEQQTARDPLVTGQGPDTEVAGAGTTGTAGTKENCAQDDLSCLPSVDQEAGPADAPQ